MIPLPPHPREKLIFNPQEFEVGVGSIRNPLRHFTATESDLSAFADDNQGLFGDEDSSHDEKVEPLPEPPKKVTYTVMLVIFLSSLNSVLLGFDVGVMSGAILFINDDFHLDPGSAGIIVGSLNIVSLLGAIVLGRLADARGRKITIFISSVLFMAGALWSAFSQGFVSLLIGRIITGLGVGGAFVIGPLYAAELAPTHVRGLLTTCAELFLNLGILSGYFCNITMEEWTNQWRWMIGVGSIPSGVIMLALTVMPESPRWLMAKGHHNKAAQVLRMTLGKRAGEVAIQQMHQVAASAKGEEKKMASWKSLLCPDPVLKMMLCAGVGIAFFQQATGNEALVYYTPSILQSAGVADRKHMLWGNIAVGGFKTLFVLVHMLLTDFVGRRPLLLVGQVINTIALGLQAYASHIMSSQLSVISLCLNMSSWSLGIGPVTHIIGTEVFPSQVRGRIYSLALGVNRLTSGTVALIFPAMQSSLLGISGSFTVFACMSVLTIPFCYWYIPETQGKSLEEIYLFFRRRAGAQEDGYENVETNAEEEMIEVDLVPEDDVHFNLHNGFLDSSNDSQGLGNHFSTDLG